MTKEQKQLILSLLSSAYTDKNERLKNLRTHDDNFLAEIQYENEIKLIESTYKEIEKLYYSTELLL